MPIYKIADLNIKTEPIYDETRRRMEPYLTNDSGFCFDATVTPGEIKSYMSDQGLRCPPQLAEGPLILTKICREILNSYDGFFFHCSCLELDGEGYLFTAVSGTGKSTHAALWRELFGDRVTMINDDKPIIRKTDGGFKVYGTPWMGKSDIGCNMSAPIKAVFVLERSNENKAERVSPGAVFRQLIEATLMPSDRSGTQKLLGLFDGLFSQAKLFKLSCNMDIAAARTAYEAANTREEESQ